MNILVTGANGQLGNELRKVAAQSKQGDTWFFTDVAELDICDETAIELFVKSNEIECILNCAAYTNVNGAESNVELCDRLNHLAPGNLARVAKSNYCRLVHISTDYVFNGKHYMPYTEDDEPCPNSVYGSTKLAGEKLVQACYPQAIIIRTAWLYSSFGNNFVKTMIKLGQERTSVGVVFDQIGTPTYAFDLARAIDKIIHSVAWVPGIYHYSDEGVCSWYDFARAIHEYAGLSEKCNVRPLHTVDYPTPASRPPYSVLDKTKIKNIYGVMVPHWTVSLKECIKEL